MNLKLRRKKSAVKNEIFCSLTRELWGQNCFPIKNYKKTMSIKLAFGTQSVFIVTLSLYPHHLIVAPFHTTLRITYFFHTSIYLLYALYTLLIRSCLVQLSLLCTFRNYNVWDWIRNFSYKPNHFNTPRLNRQLSCLLGNIKSVSCLRGEKTSV